MKKHQKYKLILTDRRGKHSYCEFGFGFWVSAPSPCIQSVRKWCIVEKGEGWDEVMEEAFRGVRFAGWGSPYHFEKCNETKI